MYRIRILGSAKAELAGLDKTVGKRVSKKIAWLAEHLEDLKPEMLTQEWADLFKLRVGDYRVLYEILEDERLIVVHKISHRREVYKRR